MEKIKNLKINWKKTISILLTTTVLSTISGCCMENHEEIIENQNNTISSLEQEKANLQEQLNKLTEAPEPETARENLNDNMNNLSSDGAVQLFYENGVLKVDSIGQLCYLKYYDEHNGGPDTGDNAGYVQELIKDGKKYLVDANDFSKVLLSDYEKINKPYHLKYYDAYFGGPDESKTANCDGGYVQEIIKDGKKYLIDANFSKVLLSDYEKINKPYHLKYYDANFGGPDESKSANYDGGYVQEIIKDEKKYLVDANDFTIILASDYKSVIQNEIHIIVTYNDGHQEVYANRDFKPTKSKVLIR